MFSKGRDKEGMELGGWEQCTGSRRNWGSRNSDQSIPYEKLFSIKIGFTWYE